ncbi:hypothetical protein RKD19_006797 [Streptomyces canus]
MQQPCTHSQDRCVPRGRTNLRCTQPRTAGASPPFRLRYRTPPARPRRGPDASQSRRKRVATAAPRAPIRARPRPSANVRPSAGPDAGHRRARLRKTPSPLVSSSPRRPAPAHLAAWPRSSPRGRRQARHQKSRRPSALPRPPNPLPAPSRPRPGPPSPIVRSPESSRAAVRPIAPAPRLPQPPAPGHARAPDTDAPAHSPATATAPATSLPSKPAHPIQPGSPKAPASRMSPHAARSPAPSAAPTRAPALLVNHARRHHGQTEVPWRGTRTRPRTHESCRRGPHRSSGRGSP